MKTTQGSRSLCFRAASVVAATASLLLGAPRAARAEQTYPGDVDMALGVPMVVETKIAPTTGCLLCHTSESGGTTTLQPFANYLIASYDFPKAAAVEDGNVLASLAKLKAAEPKLWADMQAGINPNTDPLFTEAAPPQPEYGCSSSGAPPKEGAAPLWVVPIAGILAATRRLRGSRRRRLEAPGPSREAGPSSAPDCAPRLAPLSS